MNCLLCKNVVGQPIEMARLYVKNHQSRMNRSPEKFNPIGWICPQCHTMVYGNSRKRERT